MGSDLNRKVRRAARLTELFTTIYARALVRAVQNADPVTQSRINRQFSDAVTAFVTHGVQIGDAVASLKRKPFAVFGLWSDLSGDVFEEERGKVGQFCRDWHDFAGIDLSAEDADLIGAPNAG